MGGDRGSGTLLAVFEALAGLWTICGADSQHSQGLWMKNGVVCGGSNVGWPCACGPWSSNVRVAFAIAAGVVEALKPFVGRHASVTPSLYWSFHAS